jgi:hypothetical protein
MSLTSYRAALFRANEKRLYNLTLTKGKNLNFAGFWRLCQYMCHPTNRLLFGPLLRHVEKRPDELALGALIGTVYEGQLGRP